MTTILTPKIFFCISIFDLVRYKNEVEEFGITLRKLRDAANLSQQDLADEAEISKRTVQRLEKGQYSATLDIVFALAEALKIKAKDFFDRE